LALCVIVSDAGVFRVEVWGCVEWRSDNKELACCVGALTASDFFYGAVVRVGQL